MTGAKYEHGGAVWAPADKTAEILQTSGGFAGDGHPALTRQANHTGQ